MGFWFWVSRFWVPPIFTERPNRPISNSRGTFTDPGNRASWWSGVWGQGSRVCGLGPGAWGLGSRIWGLGPEVLVLGSKVWGLGPGFWGKGSGIWGQGSGIRGLGFLVWGMVSGVLGLGYGACCQGSDLSAGWWNITLNCSSCGERQRLPGKKEMFTNPQTRPRPDKEGDLTRRHLPSAVRPPSFEGCTSTRDENSTAFSVHGNAAGSGFRVQVHLSLSPPLFLSLSLALCLSLFLLADPSWLFLIASSKQIILDSHGQAAPCLESH